MPIGEVNIGNLKASNSFTIEVQRLSPEGGGLKLILRLYR